MPLFPVMTGTTPGGESFSLARLRREDLPSTVGAYQNLELTTALSGYGSTQSAAEDAEWLEANLKNQSGQERFGIYDSSETIIGTVALRNINHRTGTAELGIVIYHPAHWGKGYGSGATLLICQYGAFHLSLHNIMLKVFAFNERAIRAYQKVGFHEIGRRTGAALLGQERFDEVYMELLTEGLDVSDLRKQIRQLT